MILVGSWCLASVKPWQFVKEAPSPSLPAVPPLLCGERGLGLRHSAPAVMGESSHPPCLAGSHQCPWWLWLEPHPREKCLAAQRRVTGFVVLHKWGILGSYALPYIKYTLYIYPCQMFNGQELRVAFLAVYNNEGSNPLHQMHHGVRKLRVHEWSRYKETWQPGKPFACLERSLGDCQGQNKVKIWQ